MVEEGDGSDGPKVKEQGPKRKLVRVIDHVKKQSRRLGDEGDECVKHLWIRTTDFKITQLYILPLN